MLLIAGGVHVVSMFWHVLGFQVLLTASLYLACSVWLTFWPVFSSYFYILGFQGLLIAIKKSLLACILVLSFQVFFYRFPYLACFVWFTPSCHNRSAATVATSPNVFGGVCNMNYKSSERGITKRPQYDWFSRVIKCALRESFNSLNS